MKKRFSGGYQPRGSGDAPIGRKMSTKASDEMFGRTASHTHRFNAEGGKNAVRDDRTFNPNGSPMRGGIRL